MAKSKSASRKSAAKKAAKTRKSRPVAKKAAKTRKQRTAGKKAAATRKRQVVAKKAVAPRTTKAAAVATGLLETTELDNRIAILRDNLRELVEQAASYSGASDEERMSERIAEQEAKLELLMKQREELSQRGS